MLFSVTFNVGKRDVCACWRALRKEKFQKKKALIPFSLLLPCCGCGCVDVVVKLLPSDINKFEHCAFGVSLGFCMMPWVLFACCLVSGFVAV